ncbi:HK97 family phage prohead protease [Nitrospirillum bahiense]|uniref:Prohead serine protease domain-containing protein n=1 Tax=Nitrospirillum amazonense TaxID=28077 RepID=A0A560FC67_9PROT|nr:HK97 family phage prohead protease [Nitrospirillum amazonense]TWB19206.1 hypothetical protein FBZ88_12261 [Nitrospirillum amazonense]
MERRDIEIRLTPDDTGLISGYAALWGKPDAFGDVVTPGAFAKSLEQHRAAGTRPLMLWAHDPATPIGVWDAIEEDTRGLKVTGRLVMDATAGRDAFAMVKAGAVDGLSIGFRTTKAQKQPQGGRRVDAMDLIEVSLVARPAQPAARITSVRSHPEAAGIAAHIRQCAERLKGMK